MISMRPCTISSFSQLVVSYCLIASKLTRINARPANFPSSVIPYRKIESNPLLESYWKLIQTWLSSCTSEHRGCIQGQSNFRPQYLIDVNNLRLVDSYTCGKFVRYATISHCWGAKSIYCLTKATFHSFRTGIDYHVLPPNFQHAIYAARRLELDYTGSTPYVLFKTQWTTGDDRHDEWVTTFAMSL